MNETNTLLNLKVGESAKVRTLLTATSMRRRLQDIGLVEGTIIKCLQKSPFGEPVAYLIRGAVIALRSEETEKILIEHVTKDV